MAKFGSEELHYQVVEGWGKLPENWKFGHVIGVEVDSRDRVYVFNRGENPVIIFDKEGAFLSSWGKGVFKNPHGIYIDDRDSVYCTDSGDHTVRKFTANGELLRIWGTRDEPKEEEPFNRPTDFAIAPTGEMYVSDGYGNSKVHKYSADGDFLFSWGEKGDAPGQFDLPHDVCVHKDGRVFVADRQNHRVQIFDPDGILLDMWTGFKQPCSVYIDAEERVFVTELQARMSILDIEGNLLTRWGEEKSKALGLFIAPHASAVDSQGGLYIGETLEGSRIQKFVI